VPILQLLDAFFLGFLGLWLVVTVIIFRRFVTTVVLTSCMLDASGCLFDGATCRTSFLVAYFHFFFDIFVSFFLGF
jgi:hypothetical protein